MKKRGQQTIGMPFGMIFAIFLIVVFIVVAFVAVGKFLDIGKSVEVGTFYEDFQKVVSDAWLSQSSELTFEVNLPSKITHICLGNLSAKITGNEEYYNQIKNYDVYTANTFLIPPENAEQLQYKQIEHLDIERITENENPYCLSVNENLKISKGFYDKLVLVE